MVGVKQSNRSAVLKLLHEEGGMSRKQLAARLNLTPAAITIIVNEMIAESILREGVTIPSNGAVGRKEISIDINSTEFLALGFSINIGEAKLSATDLLGKLIYEEQIPLPEYLTPDYVVELGCERITALLKEKGCKEERIIGLGISVRGLADSKNGISINSVGLWDKENVPVREMFQKRLPFPVVVDNNIRSLANALIFLRKNHAPESMLFIRSERGLGAALVLNHHLYEGYHNRSVEIGHVVVVPGGYPCYCGNRGCLETVASMKGILREAALEYDEERTPILYQLTDGDKNKLTFDNLVLAARRGDFGSSRVIETAITKLSEVLLFSIHLLDIPRVVFYGNIFENKYFMEQLKRRLCTTELLSINEDMFETVNMDSKLDVKAAPVLAVKHYFNVGGKR